MRIPGLVGSFVACLTVVFGGAFAFAQTQDTGGGEDEVTMRQSMDAYMSLEDGQPSAPGTWELELNLGWLTTSGESDVGILVPEIEYTPDGSDFLRNMQLGLAFPFEVGDGGIDGNGDAEIAWQQRWVADDGTMPTLATIFSMRAPSGYQSSGVDGTFTGILAKDCGPGTFFLNGWVTTANGNNVDDIRHFQWGGRVAYLWRFAEGAALTVDYVNQTSEEDGESNMNLVEVGAQFKVNENLTLGPGILVGVDGKESTPNFGAGIRFTFSF